MASVIFGSYYDDPESNVKLKMVIDTAEASISVENKQIKSLLQAEEKPLEWVRDKCEELEMDDEAKKVDQLLGKLQLKLNSM